MGPSRHQRIQRVGGPPRKQLLAGGDQRPGGRREQLRGAIAQHEPLGLHAVALGEEVPQLRAPQVGVLVQAPAGHEGDRVDDPGMGQLGPGGLRQVEHVDAGERFTASLGCFLAERLVDLLLGHRFELLVVVQEAHMARSSSAEPRRTGSSRAPGAPAQAPGLPEKVLEPGPWMTRNQNANTAPQRTAVAPKILPITPVRWS